MWKHLASLGLSLALCGPQLAARALAKPSAGSANTASKPNKRGKAAKEKAPCFAPAVQVARVRGPDVETRSLSLTFCDGGPNPAAVDSVSVLSRPRDVERPELGEIRAYQRLPVDRGPKSKRRDATHVSKQVMRVHPGLLVRLQRVAERFPGKTIEIVSGHRPDARDTSRHHHGRALDMRVAGVSRETLRDFLRTFPETGVGYYPNSFFVHMDVRDDKGYWVDRSGPGERPDYGPWPPAKTVLASTGTRLAAGGSVHGQNMVNQALSELENLQVKEMLDDARARAHEGRAQAQASAREQVIEAWEAAHPKLPEHHSMKLQTDSPVHPLPARPVASAAEVSAEEDGDLAPEEIERIRKQARAAIDAL